MSADPIQEALDAVKKLGQYDRYTEKTATAGLRTEGPLKDRIAKNTEDAEAQATLQKIIRGEAVDNASEEHIEKAVDRFVDQLISKVFK